MQSGGHTASARSSRAHARVRELPLRLYLYLFLYLYLVLFLACTSVRSRIRVAYPTVRSKGKAVFLLNRFTYRFTELCFPFTGTAPVFRFCLGPVERGLREYKENRRCHRQGLSIGFHTLKHITEQRFVSEKTFGRVRDKIRRFGKASVKSKLIAHKNATFQMLYCLI